MTSEVDGKPKIQAEDNPWYLLATLYGQPSSDDCELQPRNRGAWNRYVSRWFGDDITTKLIGEGRHPHGELTPFSTEEIELIQKAFVERRLEAGSSARALPDLKDGRIDFSNVQFDEPFRFDGFCLPAVSFQNATFSKLANFERATFCDEANFENATLCDKANFQSTIFSDNTAFSHATFADMAHFSSATFARTANFPSATFSGAFFVSANFSNVNFADTAFGPAVFNQANFFIASFANATFSAAADFEATAFSKLANFERTTFRSTISFVNAEMKGPTSFEAATFNAEPPRFFGAKLHEGTVWPKAHWPSPRIAAEAGAFVDAYERLKLEMDRLKKHEDELDFFALELRSRRVLAGTFPGLPIALYGLLCDYGRSYVRPLLGLLVTVAIGAVLCLPHFGSSKYPQAIGLSLANTFGVLGFRKDFIDPHVIETLSRALKLASAVQTLFGVVLLFFFGLAVRNRFRMR
jgi:uncharacterized protein YjbI with pentapeptide repeats